MKATNKTIRAYYQAKREWISANDNYNKAHFGITQAQYSTLRQVESHLFGIMAGTERMTPKEVNESINILGLQL